MSFALNLYTGLFKINIYNDVLDWVDKVDNKTQKKLADE